MDANIGTGEKIRSARHRLGLTQDQLAAKMNDMLSGGLVIERSMISRWEKELAFPTKERRSVMELVLNIDLGTPPPRKETKVSYFGNRQDFFVAINQTFAGSREYWNMKRHFNRHQVPQPSNGLQYTMDPLRTDPDCHFREIFFITSADDLKQMKKILMRNFPNYHARAAVRDLPSVLVFASVSNKKAVIMPEHGEDGMDYGMFVSGEPVIFAEQYFREFWDEAIPVFTGMGLIQKNIQTLEKSLKHKK